jgi:altronate dehydratase
VDIAACVDREWHGLDKIAALRPGMRIAVGVGSRVISNQATMVREVVGRLRACGCRLFVTPGITAQEAAGCVMTIFTTGRGAPAGFATPLLRVASTSAIAKRKAGWVDCNAGVLMQGKTMDEAAEALFNMVLKVAGGEIQTVAEANRYRQIGFFKDGVTD